MSSQGAAALLATLILDTPRPDYSAAFHPVRFSDQAYRSVLATLDAKSGQL
jgi:hypothetical protein